VEVRIGGLVKRRVLASAGERMKRTGSVQRGMREVGEIISKRFLQGSLKKKEGNFPDVGKVLWGVLRGDWRKSFQGATYYNWGGKKDNGEEKEART